MIASPVKLRERLGFVLIVALLAGFLATFNLVDRIDYRIYDLVSRSWTPPEPSNVAIITIDESSLFELGRFPWSRRMHANLVETLMAADAAAVGFDIIFAEPDWQDLAGDQALADAVARYGRVVMPVFSDVRINGQSPEEIRPLPKLVNSGVGLGHVEIGVDADGVVRRINQFSGLRSEHPALSLALLDRASQGQSDSFDPLYSTSIWLNDDWLLIPFSTRNRFDHMTFADIVQGRVSAERLHGKLVLVGATASGLGSTFSTPLSSNGTPMPGVIVHAHLLHALSHEVLWHQLAKPAQIILMILFAGALAVLIQISARPVLSLAAGLGCLVVVSAALLQLSGVWMPPAAAIVGALAALIGWGVVIRQQEKAVARAERERASVTIRAIADAVITAGPDGRVDYLNPAAQALTGWPFESARGRILPEVLRVQTQTREPINLAGPELDQDWVRARLRSRDGKKHEILISRGQIFDERERPAGHVIVLHDISNQERARHLFEQSESRRQQLERELQHAGRLSAVGQVSASIAHEVNQPLTAITTYASAARRLVTRNDPGSQAKLLDAVRKMGQQAERAGGVIRRLRLFFEKGREEVGLHNLVETVDEALELALLGAAKLDVQVEVDLDSNVPPLVFDRIQIQQVMVNLVRNAVEAIADSDRRILRISSCLRDTDIEISVADTGSGIPVDVQATLFEPFNSSKPGGMGLGLSISRTIIEAHGGELRARPADGGGTIFSFNLPLQVYADA